MGPKATRTRPRQEVPLSGLNSGRPLGKTNGVLSASKKTAAKTSVAKGNADSCFGRSSALAETAIPEVEEGRLRHVLQRIESGPCCTIHSLAVEFNLSSSRLQHLFKQHTGICLGHAL